ncbi:hypothetical protein QVD17_15920 [Tagetes erecta]|uniref:Uncharacterized protein n=1 Tax=Tagetes erecta TaxID=13708 RepID=A0AAD8KQI7_TARER|nr:hypothetical protein QVD17_15920 [Tagetes erecta]
MWHGTDLNPSSIHSINQSFVLSFHFSNLRRGGQRQRQWRRRSISSIFIVSLVTYNVIASIEGVKKYGV